MAIAYAVVLVMAEMYDHNREESVRVAQRSADEQFEALAIDVRKTLVTRDPEPRVMPYRELEDMFPTLDTKGIVGLYFTADIS